MSHRKKSLFKGRSFYLAPGRANIPDSTRQMVCQLVKQNGGSLTADFDPDSPVFAATSALEELVFTFGLDRSRAVSVDFIIDSCKQGHTLDLENYALGSERASPKSTVGRGAKGSGSGSGRSKSRISSSGKSSAGYSRRPYSDSDDQALLDTLYSRGLLLGAKLAGNAVWIKLGRAKVPALKGRSWQSLRDRYTKKLRGSVAWQPTRDRMLGWGLNPEQGWEAIHKVGRGKGGGFVEIHGHPWPDADHEGQGRRFPRLLARQGEIQHAGSRAATRPAWTKGG